MKRYLNQWSVLVLGIWLISMVACAFTKNSDPMNIALIVTLAAGVAWSIRDSNGGGK